LPPGKILKRATQRRLCPDCDCLKSLKLRVGHLGRLGTFLKKSAWLKQPVAKNHGTGGAGSAGPIPPNGPVGPSLNVVPACDLAPKLLWRPLRTIEVQTLHDV
jgi:hypothetical protein